MNYFQSFTMLKIVLGIILTAFILLLTSVSKAAKKSLGSELVPAGTSSSPGLLAGNTLYISGLQGTDLEKHKLPNEFDLEVKNCLDNVGRVLKDGGMSYSDVVSVQIFLDDMSHFPAVNAIYKRYFTNPMPSRTTVQVTKLSLGARIEIAAVAQK